MSPSAPTPSAPLKRRSKACENCRVRRTKCSGEVPCGACVSNNIAGTCHIRAKARPSRALPERIKSASSTINPLGTIEVNLTIWCFNHPDIPIDSLSFKDRESLEVLATFAPPIPADHHFEDHLMSAFLNRQEEFDSLDFTDKGQLVSLYSRYRTLPSSLTEDQLALVYAALCTARALQVMNRKDEGPTEDVTYYALATDHLRRWNRPSKYACWALFCLIPYAQSFGGSLDSRWLLEQMARHITDLGIHRKATSCLYSPHDMVNVLLSACAYLDIFTAGLLGLQPTLPFSEIDVEPILMIPMFASCMCKVVYQEAKFLEDLADPIIDTTTREYISAREAEWAEDIRSLRLGLPDVPKIKALWAELRYGWLRILLYAPLYPSSCPLIARTISQILHVYAEVDELGQYQPCWVQTRQLSAVGHLLILVSEKGEFNRKEAVTLWDMLFDFLDRDPQATNLATAFRRTALAFGIEPRVSINGTGPVSQIDSHFPFGVDMFSWFMSGETNVAGHIVQGTPVEMHGYDGHHGLRAPSTG